ncbi:VP2 [Mycoreovirus 1]|uniref:Inner capsid protein VP2 n=1 Tax=Cryphonectria parasitica mycoreovirus 1 (strain 9B21) TaxID=230407 RepID=CAPSD_MYRV9|nr:VP2 [Mycoreovirus 1]Q7TDB5.1 RecName: Full=Uncharacterized protein VP2 [Cryphonectria parasitica mycoreovirus 1]AAP45578.1 VP2 [Cryphonectria parasitica mycoreovirus 1]
MSTSAKKTPESKTEDKIEPVIEQTSNDKPEPPPNKVDSVITVPTSLINQVIQTASLQENGIVALLNHARYISDINNIHVQSAETHPVPAVGLLGSPSLVSLKYTSTHSSVEFPTTTPHFYAARPIPSDNTSELLRIPPVNVVCDPFPFIPGMAKQYSVSNYNVRLMIDVSHPGIEMIIDPFSISNTKITVDGIQAFDINAFSGGLITDANSGFGSRGMPYIFSLISGLLAVSRKIGRFVMIDNIGNEKNRVLTDRIECPTVPGLSHMRGRFLKDDYERYPHVFEAIPLVTNLPWFRREIEDNVTTVPFGTNHSIPPPNVSNMKVAEYVYCGTDVTMAQFHSNFLDEVSSLRFSHVQYIRLLNSLVVNRNEITGYTTLLQFREYSAAHVPLQLSALDYSTFPYDRRTSDCLRFMVHYSAAFRVAFSDFTSSLISSIIQQSEIKTAADFNATHTGMGNTINNSTTSFHEVLRGFLENIRPTTSHDITRALSLEFFPSFYDLAPTSTHYGAVMATTFLTDLLTLAMTFVMHPVTYSYNPHLKAYAILEFCQAYFNQEVETLLQQSGWGTNVTGIVITDVPSIAPSRIESGVYSFTLLQPVNLQPLVPPPMWNLFTRTLAFLNAPFQTYTVSRPAIAYAQARNVVIPGVPIVPSGPYSRAPPVATYLLSVIQLATTYTTISKQVGLGMSTSKLAAAMTSWRVVVRAMILNFGEWFHGVYCFAAYNAALLYRLIMPYDNTPPTNWQAFPSVQEDLARLNLHNIHNAPRIIPTQAMFPHDDTRTVLGPKHMHSILALYHTPSSAHVCGKLNADKTVADWPDLVSFYYGIDPQEIVEIYKTVLNLASSFGESIQLSSEMSTGDLLSPDLRVLLRSGIMAKVFSARTFQLFAKFLGVGVTDGSIMSQSGSLIDMFNTDPRIYFPNTGMTTVFTDQLIQSNPVGDMIRPAVRNNFRILLDSVFGPEGMMPITSGFTASLEMHSNLRFSLTHSIRQVEIIFGTGHQVQYDDGLRGLHIFSCTANQIDATGQRVPIGNMIAFAHIEQLIDNLSTIVGYSVVRPIAIVPEINQLPAVLVEDIITAFLGNVICLSFPEHRVVRSYAYLSPASVVAATQLERNLVREILEDRTVTHCHHIRIFDTEIIQGVFETTMRKPLLPQRPKCPVELTTHLHTPNARVGGTPINFDRFLPLVEVDASGRLLATNQRGVKRDAITTRPYALRTPLLVWMQSPYQKLEGTVHSQTVRVGI